MQTLQLITRSNNVPVVNLVTFQVSLSLYPILHMKDSAIRSYVVFMH